MNKSDSSIHDSRWLSAHDLFIFDLDGTLYDQHRLRNMMVITLLFRLLTFRISLAEIKIITCFRRLREQKLGYASTEVYEDQFRWTAQAMGIQPAEVKQVIEQWMLVYPLRLLRKTRYRGVKSFITYLKSRNKSVAVFSDFPVDRKLDSLGLQADRTYCSTDSMIAQLKPTRKGMELICSDFGCPPEKAVYFGDREDTDGESARMAGVHFIRVDVRQARRGRFYRHFLNHMMLSHDPS